MNDALFGHLGACQHEQSVNFLFGRLTGDIFSSRIRKIAYLYSGNDCENTVIVL